MSTATVLVLIIGVLAVGLLLTLGKYCYYKSRCDELQKSKNDCTGSAGMAYAEAVKYNKQSERLLYDVFRMLNMLSPLSADDTKLILSKVLDENDILSSGSRGATLEYMSRLASATVSNNRNNEYRYCYIDSYHDIIQGIVGRSTKELRALEESKQTPSTNKETLS